MHVKRDPRVEMPSQLGTWRPPQAGHAAPVTFERQAFISITRVGWSRVRVQRRGHHDGQICPHKCLFQLLPVEAEYIVVGAAAQERCVVSALRCLVKKFSSHDDVFRRLRDGMNVRSDAIQDMVADHDLIALAFDEAGRFHVAGRLN